MGGCLFVVCVELWSLYDDEHEQGHSRSSIRSGTGESDWDWGCCCAASCWRARAPYMLGDLPFYRPP